MCMIWPLSKRQETTLRHNATKGEWQTVHVFNFDNWFQGSCTQSDPCASMIEIYGIMYMSGYFHQIYRPPIKVTDIEVQKVCRKSTPMYYSTDKILKYLWAIKVFYGWHYSNKNMINFSTYSFCPCYLKPSLEILGVIIDFSLPVIINWIFNIKRLEGWSNGTDSLVWIWINFSDCCKVKFIPGCCIK